MTLIDRIAVNFASLGPLGRLPVSGTWGSAVAALAAPCLFMSATTPVRLLILVLLFIGGGLACDIVERQVCMKDPGLCIIDEVLGQWVTYCLFCTLTPWQLFWGFVLFRVFDIVKPWPVRNSENWLPGGFGVMIDDVLAGVYAAVALWGCSRPSGCSRMGRRKAAPRYSIRSTSCTSCRCRRGRGRCGPPWGRSAPRSPGRT